MSDPLPPPHEIGPTTGPTAPPQYAASAVARARNLLDAPPEQIGRYRILERIGGGGMGEVYRAEQRSPVRREVAIKLIKLGMDTKLVIARFEAERQALAMMDHPNIAKVYDADADGTGRPYFVMEYVKGKPITDYADANHLTIDERLALFEQVCHAIQHAHHKGIIHRDLKPSNVLVSTQDGKPHAKVIDFGIAKATSQRLTDKTLYTEHEQFIGTPQYVSPEQADGSLDIDTRTDVYSLGVLLYELLAGSTPFAGDELRAAAVEKIKQMIREVDPPKPSTRLSMSAQTLPSLAAARRVEVKKLGSLLRGELDWIVMKALEKDRRRRYETPTALANDIRAHLTGEPVTAAPPTASYRFRKFVWRYQAPLAVAAALAVVLIAGVVASAWQALRARRAERTVSAQLVEVDRQRKSADDSREVAQTAQGVAEQQAKLAAKAASLSQARYLIQQGDLPGAMACITQASAAGLSFADRLVLDEAYRVSRDYWSLVSHVRTGSRPRAGCMVEFDDNRAPVVVAVVGNELMSFPTDTAKPAWQQTTLDVVPRELLATRASAVVAWTRAGQLRAYDVSHDKLLAIAKRDLGSEITDAAASDKTITLAFVDGACRTLDARTLEVVNEWPAEALPLTIRGAPGKRCFASPDGKVVIIHDGPWNMPVYILRAGSATSVESRAVRMGALAFTRPAAPPTTQSTAAATNAPLKFITWMSPSGWGGLPDIVSTYTMDEQSNVQLRDEQSVDSFDTKIRVALRVSQIGRMTMFGQVGATWIASNFSRAKLPSVRYTSFWPFADAEPEFFAASETGTRFVLSLRDGLLVFNRNGESALNTTVDNFSSWAIRDGLLKVVEGANAEPPTIAFEPYDPTERRWSVTPQWVKPEPASQFKAFAPWRIHVTPDEQHAVILAQENDGESSITSVYGRKIAMVYNLHGDARHEQGWKSARLVEFPSLTGVTGFSNGLLRITPDGKTVLLGVRTQLHRYDVATGQRLGTMDFGPTYFDLSRDGTMIVGRAAGAKEVLVHSTVTGEPICTLNDAGSYGGGAFSDDGKLIAIKAGGRQVILYEIPSGREVWAKRSNLVPRNWPATGKQFLAQMPETSGEGSMLVLADKDTLEPQGVVSKAFERLSDCGFSPSFDAIHTQISRWQSRIIRMVDPDGLTRLLQTPNNAAESSTAGGTATVATVVDAREALAPTAGAEADGPMNGEDVARIGKYIDRIVTVDATVAKVTWTAARNAINIECAAGALTGDAPPLVIWINPLMVRKLRAAGVELAPDKPTLDGKHLRIRGRVGTYGGYDPKFKGRPQLYAEDTAGFELLDRAE